MPGVCDPHSEAAVTPRQPEDVGVTQHFGQIAIYELALLYAQLGRHEARRSAPCGVVAELPFAIP